MRKIKDIISKPSQALKAMCDGLEKQSKRKDFKINMTVFGADYDGENICCGCAATCTIMELSGVDFTIKNIDCVESRSIASNIELNDINTFESVMDCARKGHLSPLFDYFNLLEDHFSQYDRLWDITDLNWRTEIKKVRDFISVLEENEV